MDDTGSKGNFQKLVFKIAKATLITAATGVVWLALWFLTSIFMTSYPQYSEHFAVMAWVMLFFTFAIIISEETIYKYIFMIIRAFFLIFYIAYATNYGLLYLSFENYTLNIEFIPLLTIMILANLIDVARRLLQAIEFASQSPKD